MWRRCGDASGPGVVELLGLAGDPAAGDVHHALWNRPSGPVARSGDTDVLGRPAARLALGTD